MKPVFQPHTRRVQDGECLRAAVASILEISFDESYDYRNNMIEQTWFGHFIYWLAHKGYAIHCEYAKKDMEFPPFYFEGWEPFFIGIVTTSRSSRYTHCVVYDKFGNMVHDPKVGGSEIVEIKERWFFKKMN